MKYAKTLYLHNNIFKTFYLEPFPPVKHFVSFTGQTVSLSLAPSSSPKATTAGESFSEGAKRERIIEKILLCFQISDNQ